MKKKNSDFVKYCREKVGTPYFYGSKMEVLTESFMATMHTMYPSTVTDAYMQKARNKGNVGKVNVDCSGLIGAFRGKQIGSSQLYQTAYARLSTKDYTKWADAVVCWRKGHVGVFSKEDGKYFVYEAKGIDYGTVKSVFDASKWTCGLTFDDIDYTYDEAVEVTYKGVNPYEEPTTNLKIGAKGEGVKWLQWELNEAGFDLDIDGDFGAKTDQAVREFREECDLNGMCDKKTRKFLKADSKNAPDNAYTFGIDVSKYQGNIQWDKVFADGKRFAVLKVTHKDNCKEVSFDRNYAGCRANGIAVAVYRYVYATSIDKAKAEANAIVKALEGKWLDGEVWLDMEDKSIASIGKSALTLMIDTEAEILKAAGYKVGVYCNRDWYEDILDGEGLSKKYPIWIAKYGKNDGSWENRDDNPKDIAVAWQYSSRGSVNGIEGNVDLDLIY